MARFMERAETKKYQRIFDPVQRLTRVEFLSRYRLSKECVIQLSEMIDSKKSAWPTFGRPIPTHIKMCACLRFLACGSFQQVVGDTLHISQPSCCRAIWSVVESINEVANNHIIFPTEDSILSIKADFYSISKFPKVIGCIDGTHIRIISPHVNSTSFVNRKGFHSINVMAVCDARCKFIYVSARWPGSSHDSFILKSSALWDIMESQENEYEDCVILGDKGYPCRRWLMTPYYNPESNSEIRFNKSLCRTRSKIECAFGILKKRFNCFHQELRFAPSRCSSIITTGIIMHNIAMSSNIPLPDDSTTVNVEQTDQTADLPLITDGLRGVQHRRMNRDQFFPEYSNTLTLSKCLPSIHCILAQ